MSSKYEKTLGPKSAKLINLLLEKGQDIFTLNDAYEIYDKGKEETTNLLHYLVQRKVIARIKPGVFIILKAGLETTQLSNWPMIARALAGQNQYFISHYSAMRLHGMTTHPLNQIFISFPKKRNKRLIQNTTYQFIYTKPERFWGIMDFWVTKHEKIHVSDLERTLLDALERPELCGGIKEIAQGIWSSKNKIDWEKLIAYAKRFPTIASVKRLGFILETLKLGTQYLEDLEKYLSQKKDYVLLDPNGEKMGNYLKRWKIRINMNIEELKIGSA